MFTYSVSVINSGLFNYMYSLFLDTHTHTHTPRVVWVFGGEVKGPILEVTPTRLTSGVLATLRQADYIAQTSLANHGIVSTTCVFCVNLIVNIV